MRRRMNQSVLRLNGPKFSSKIALSFVLLSPQFLYPLLTFNLLIAGSSPFFLSPHNYSPSLLYLAFVLSILHHPNYQVDELSLFAKTSPTSINGILRYSTVVDCNIPSSSLSTGNDGPRRIRHGIH